MKHLLFAILLLPAAVLHAQVPQLINYQGRVAVGTVNFNGSGQFKFALVNTAGTTTYWSNDGTSTAGSQPTAAVTLTVTKGLYSVLLGDTALANMTAIPSSVFANPDVRLRVWFNDGTNGSQLLTPDQRLAPNGYLPDAAVTTAKIATGAVDSAQLANAAVTNPKLAAGSVGTNKLADGAVTGAKIGSGAVGTAQLAAGALGTPVTVGGAAQAMVANTSYTATGAAQTAFTLPTTVNVGDTVQVSATGAGGWSVAPGSGQSYVGQWTPRESNRSWQSVASSADGSKLVAVESGGVSGGYVYTSTDSGVSWTARMTDANRFWQSVASSADGGKLVAVVGFVGQIYTSTDSGVSWTARESNRNWISVASSADGGKLVAVEKGGQIYTSTDSGVNWTSRESNRVWQSVASSADGSKLVAVVNPGGQIYTSTDSGVSWTSRESSRDWYSVASSADGSKLVAVEKGGQIYTSTDSGVNWTSRESSRDWYSVASSADGSKLVAVVVFGQIYTSTDSGVSWTARESNRTWLSVASSADGSKLVAVERGGQIYTSAPSGAAGSTATLQYLGNGEWTALIPASPLAFGSVGSAQLAPGSVTSSAIADSSVTGTDIAPSTITNSNVAAAAAISATKLGTGVVDNTEFGYLDGVTSGIQGQLGTLTTNLGTTNTNVSNLTTTVNGKVSKSGDTMTGTLTATELTANSATNGSFGTPFFNQNASHAGLAVQITGTGTYEPQMRFARADGQFYDIGMNGSNGFVIEDNDTARLTIDSNGHVGIGTTSPTALVTILTPPDQFGFEHRDTSGHTMATFVNGSGGWIGTTSNQPLNFYTNNSNEQMTLSTTGKLGIGTTAPTYQLQLSTDSAGKPNGGSWSNSSDRRLKQNIQPMQDALERLTRLRGVTFEWRNPEDHANQRGTQAGFIAQEVAAVFPNWVTQVDAAEHDKALTDNGKINSLTLPFEFDALVVEAIKQQKAEMEEKDAKIATLEKEIEALKAKEAAREKREQEREARLAKLEQFIPKEPESQVKTAAIK